VGTSNRCSPPCRVNLKQLRTLAIVPWGDLIEDFLDGIGVSLTEFAEEMTGGWLFGYVDALKREGVECVLFCFSAHVREPTLLTHRATGARICVLPAPARYRRLRRRMLNPYGWSLKDTFGQVTRYRKLYSAVRHLAPYLATPVLSFAVQLRKMGCDAILCQEYESPRFDLCVAVGSILRLPVFATFQGGRWQLSRLERYVRPAALGRSAGLIIGSAEEADRVRERYRIPEWKIARLPNPLVQPIEVGRVELRQIELGLADSEASRTTPVEDVAKEFGLPA